MPMADRLRSHAVHGPARPSTGSLLADDAEPDPACVRSHRGTGTAAVHDNA
jgi:hypothetical protein